MAATGKTIFGINEQLSPCRKTDFLLTNDPITGTMRGVLYVPGLGINQYSIGHATAVSLDVIFTNNSVSFSRDEVVIMEGRRSEEKALYHLDIEVEEHDSKTERALTATQGFVKWQRILCSFARLLCCQIYQKIIKMRLNSDFRRY